MLANVKNSGESRIPDDDGYYSIEQTVESIEASSVENDLWDKVFNFTRLFGAKNFSYYHMPPVGAYDFYKPHVAFRGSDNQDLGQYKSILRKRAKNFIPTLRTLDGPTFFAKFCHIVDMDPLLSELVVNFHIRDTANGVIIPVHGGNGRGGATVIGFTDDNRRHRKREIQHIQWVCEAAHRTFCQLRRKNARKVKSISKREKEVMKWVAAGKSNTVIADIIGISPHTVNGYLRSIYLKTGASDRTTATLRCIGESLVEF
jgi:DNA-binding CsgD family transcriptional regulator